MPLSLAIKRTSTGYFDEHTSARCTYDMLLGLEFLHANGFIHGNLEASNVYMTAAGQCKLSDYGLSIYRKPLQEGWPGFTLTPNCTAPEVLDTESNVYVYASDIWSLGCTTIELLTGSPPYANIKSRIQSVLNMCTSINKYLRTCSHGSNSSG